MRVLVSVQGWPSPSGGNLPSESVLLTVRDAWAQAAPHAQVEVIGTPECGPRLGDVLAGEPDRVGEVLARRAGGALVLSPGSGTRWEPAALGEALRQLAVAGERAAVTVPLGDDAPAGDATAVWGEGLASMREAIAGLDVVALVGADRPLLGFSGMSAALRDGREHDEALAVAAQAQEDRWAAVAREVDPVAGRRTLMGPVRLSDEPGTGAAGGLAYCLAAVGARLAPGADAVAAMVGLPEAAAHADVVAVVVPRLDAAALDRGSAHAAATAAARRGVPCVAVTAMLAVGRRDLMAGGVAGAHQGEPGLDGLADQIRRVAQTWTPARRGRGFGIRAAGRTLDVYTNERRRT